MKLNYDHKDGKANYGRPDYDKCDYYEKKKPEHDDYDKCDCYDKKKRDYDDKKKYDYDNDEKCCDDHKFAKCHPKNPCPYPIIFECAQGTGAEISQTKTNGSNFFAPRSLGCLTVDTTCLKMPVVKFDFCSIIKFKSAGDENKPVRLVFQLFKQCDKGPEIACGTWDFVAAFDTPKEQLTTSFCFSHCECNSCPGCCIYTVKLIEAVKENEDDILIVSNTTLQAFAKSSF